MKIFRINLGSHRGEHIMCLARDRTLTIALVYQVGIFTSFLAYGSYAEKK